jgi:hypothetical protein
MRRPYRNIPQANQSISRDDRYYEHIIRTEQTLNAVLKYIHANPLRWHMNLITRMPLATLLGLFLNFPLYLSEKSGF